MKMMIFDNIAVLRLIPEGNLKSDMREDRNILKENTLF